MSIFLDFDGTITTEDTISHLANFALRFQTEQQQKQQQNHPHNNQGASSSKEETTSSIKRGGDVHSDDGSSEREEMSGTKRDNRDGEEERKGEEEKGDLSSRWDAVVRAYLSDYSAHASSYSPCAAERRQASEEIAFLRSGKHVETRSLGRVRSSALFRGIGPSAFRAAGAALVRDGTIRLRPGFAELVRAARAREWQVVVVSVNWSAAFIEGACGVIFPPSESESEEEERGGKKIRVLANEVREEDGAVLGPGAVTGDNLLTAESGEGGKGEEKEEGENGEKEQDTLRSQQERNGRNLTNCCDKHDVVREVLREHGTDKPFYYFGDSTTDMECLLAATRGVVVADDEEKSTLIETLRRVGKNVPHVRDARDGDTLAWASDFEEVMNSAFKI